MALEILWTPYKIVFLAMPTAVMKSCVRAVIPRIRKKKKTKRILPNIERETHGDLKAHGYRDRISGDIDLSSESVFLACRQIAGFERGGGGRGRKWGESESVLPRPACPVMSMWASGCPASARVCCVCVCFCICSVAPCVLVRMSGPCIDIVLLPMKNYVAFQRLLIW